MLEPKDKGMNQAEFNEKFDTLKNMEAKLQQPVVIETVTDLIRLLHRYREYLLHFKTLGMVVAQKHYPNHCKQVTLEDISACLYLDLDNNEQKMVFENKSWLSNFVTDDLEDSFTSFKEMRQLYNCFDILLIKSNFFTPIVISENAINQLPNSWSAYDFFHIEDVIMELEGIRKRKIICLIAEL